MATSHDQNFKNLILDYPRDALAFFAADEAPAAEDEVKITPLRQEQMKERLGDGFRELDVPVMVEWEDGRREAVLFALEEETETRKFSPHRLAHYCLNIASMNKTDRVVPVAIFLRGGGPGPGAASESLVLGTERRSYLRFEYLACRLARTPYERWRDSRNVVALVNLPNMRVSAGRRVEACVDAMRGLTAVESDPDKRAKYIEFIDTYAELDEDEYRRYASEYPKESTAMAGVIQRARDEGIQTGIQTGRQEGRQEGERAILERQLQRRFGLLPDGVVDRLNRASAADLETWADNVLDVDTLDRVFEPNSSPHSSCNAEPS